MEKTLQLRDSAMVTTALSEEIELLVTFCLSLLYLSSFG